MNVNDYLTNNPFCRVTCETCVPDVDMRAADPEYIEHVKETLFYDLAGFLSKKGGFTEERKADDMTYYRLTAYVFSQKEIRTLITDAYNAGVFHAARIKDYLHD